MTQRTPGWCGFRTLDPPWLSLDDVVEMAPACGRFHRVMSSGVARLRDRGTLTNYLCLPPAQDAINRLPVPAMAPELLAETPAVGRAEVHYTGDIDAWFAILDRFRARCSHAEPADGHAELFDPPRTLGHREDPDLT